MSSPGLLRTLLRTSSSTPAANPDSPSPKISTSPSFSDFSCNVGADFDDVDHSSTCTATPRSFEGRASMDSVDSRISTPIGLARRSIDAASLRADMRGLLFGSRGSPGQHELRQASVPTPAALEQNDKKAADQAKNEVPNSTREKARRRQKIDGMEFYEWAELIRSSSL